MVLQSVFLIRSVNDSQLAENSSIQLVAASLFASLFSISNKYSWLDKDCVTDDAKDAKWKAKIPCVNPWYLVRIIWRFCYVTTRFCILSLVWSVLGGALFGIFLAISFCTWCMGIIIYERIHDASSYDDWYVLPLVGIVYGCVSLIATPADDKLTYMVIHNVEMITSLTIITIFAYSDFTCAICADSQQRQATNNKYISPIFYLIYT